MRPIEFVDQRYKENDKAEVDTRDDCGRQAYDSGNYADVELA